MKPRQVVLLILIAALLIAWFTKPGKEDLQKYLDIDETGIGSPPIIEYTNGYVYSKFDVSYFDINNAKETYINGERKMINAPVKKEKWLGVFGKFWKMD